MGKRRLRLFEWLHLRREEAHSASEPPLSLHRLEPLLFSSPLFLVEKKQPRKDGKVSLWRFHIKDKLILSPWICLFLFVFSLFYFPSVSSNLPTDPSRLIGLLALVYRRETEAQRAETACPEALQPLARMRMSTSNLLPCAHPMLL